MENESKFEALQRLARLSKCSLIIARDFCISAKAQNQKTLEIIDSMIETLDKSVLLTAKE